MDTHHGYDDEEFKAYCDSENMAVGSLHGIVAWKAWQARKSIAIELPEITKDHIFFALNCHMEDPSDDEEGGFNAGVSWCRAFLKQQIANREKK